MRRSIISTRRRNALFALTAAVGAVTFASTAYADRFWKNGVSNGNWSTPNDWSANNAGSLDNAGPPGASDNVYITHTDATSRTVTLNQSDAIVSLQIGNSGGGTNTLSQTSSFSLGMSGALTIGTSSGGAANYLLGSGTLTVGGETVGDFGAGTFNQSGGVHKVGSDLIVAGNNGFAAGTYLLAGTGSLSVNGIEYVGYNGVGTFNQSGGVQVTQGLSIGFLNYGSYFLSGTGSLTVNGTEYINDGTFTQSGGVHTVGAANSPQELDVGGEAGGAYYLSGSGSVTVNGTTYVGGLSAGQGGSGAKLSISGGSMSVSGIVKIYNNSSTLSLIGGQLAAGSIDTSGNISDFNWTAGTLSITGASGLAIGSGELLGNSCTVNSNETLEVINTLTSNGTLNISGGILRVGALNANSGTVTLNGQLGGTFTTKTQSTIADGVMFNVLGVTSISDGQGTLQNNGTGGYGINIAGGAAGATLSMVDGTINTLIISSTPASPSPVLVIGNNTNGQKANLSFDVGEASDQIQLTGGNNARVKIGTSTTPNPVNITGLGSLSGTTQTLISAPGGLSSGTFANFVLNNTTGNFSGYTLSLGNSPTTLTLLESANPTPGAAFYTGEAAAQGGTQSFASFVNGNSNISNFSTNYPGTSNASGAVGPATNVFFTASSANGVGSGHGTGSVTFTVNQDTTVNSLSFTPGSRLFTIAGSRTLTLTGAASFTDQNGVIYPAGSGIIIQSGATAPTITVPIALGSNQSVEVDSYPFIPVILNGPIGDGSNSFGISKTGNGILKLSGLDTYHGATTISNGTLRLAGTLTNSSAIIADATAANPTIEVDNTSAVPASAMLTTISTGAFTPTLLVNGTGGPAANPQMAGLIVNGTSSSYLNINVIQSSDSMTFNSVTATAGGVGGTLAKYGSGVLNISGTQQYAPGTTIVVSDGTLNMDTSPDAGKVDVVNYATGDYNFNASSNLASLANGGIATSGGQLTTIGSLSGTGTIILNRALGATLKIGDGRSSVYSGAIIDGAGHGSLVKSGSGMLTLTAQSSYSGGTSVSGGTLFVTGSLPSTTAISVDATADDATLKVNNSTALPAVQLSATSTGAHTPMLMVDSNGGPAASLQLDSLFVGGTGSPFVNLSVGQAPDSLTINTVQDMASGGGATVTKLGPGLVTVHETHSVLQGISYTVQDGTLIIDGSSAPPHPFPDLKLLTVQPQAAFYASDSAAMAALKNDGVVIFGGSAGSVGSLSGTGSIILNRALGTTLSVGDSSNSTFDGTISEGSGPGSLTKTGTGALTLTAVSSYTGTTTVTGGALVLTGTCALPNTSAVSIDATSASAVLQVGTSTALPAVQLTATSSSLFSPTLAVDSNGGTPANVQLAGITFAGSVTSNSTITVVQPSDSVTITTVTGTAGGIGSTMTKAGAGALNITGAQTYASGATWFISEGTLGVHTDGGSNLNVTVAPSAAFTSDVPQNLASLNVGGAASFSGSTVTTGTLSGAGAVTLGLSSTTTVLTVAPTSSTVTVTFSGAISDGAGSGSLVKSGAGNFVLQGVNTYTGSTTVNGGVLKVGGSLAGSPSITVDATTTTAALTLTGTNALQTGATLTLTGAGPYTPLAIIDNSQAFAALLNYGGSATFIGGTTTIADIGGTGGTLHVCSTATLIATNSLNQNTLKDDGIVRINGGNNTVNTVAGSGVVQIASGATLNIPSAIDPISINSNGNINISGGASNAVTTVDGTGTLTVTNGANLTANYIRHGGLSVGPASTVTIAHDDQPATGGTPTHTSAVTTLLVDPAGTLDLTNNGIVILDTTSFGTVQSLITQAHDGNHWDNPGITSSTAAGDPPTATSAGHAVGYGLASALGSTFTSFNGITFSDAVIARYTLVGDHSLKGSVDLSDYTIVIQNLGLSGKLWTDGNFDYSGNVNLGDYTAVIKNIGRSDGQGVFAVTGPSAQQVKASSLTLHTAAAVTDNSTATDVTLLVNPTNGRVTLINALQTGQAVITAYTINSSSGSLVTFSQDSNGKYLATAIENNPAVFYQSSNDGTFNRWTGIKNVTTFIGEGFSQNYNANNDSTWTNYTLAAGGYALGGLFKRLSSGGVRDLVFQWNDANQSTFTSVVNYVGASVSTPEPGSVSLIVMGAMALLGRRRRHLAK